MRRTVPTVLRMAATTLVAIGVVSCGGDDGGSEPATGQVQTPALPSPSSPSGGDPNRAPSIGGTPHASVMQGAAFEFVPVASDADGDTLTFSIQGLPGWATFDSSNGRLYGMPGLGDVGAHANIRISASDGKATAALPGFAIQVVGTALGSATLSWTPPTSRADGSPLSNLAGYKVYWGTREGAYPNAATILNPGISTYVIEQLTPARWFFVVTAIDATGAESGFSNVASKTVL